ncbi:MAG: DUF11 domain-containing protein [Candidatus Promineifilaceae bacterium]|jgi:uncharacterized repeat protein (TIGR01451 family)
MKENSGEHNASRKPAAILAAGLLLLLVVLASAPVLFAQDGEEPDTGSDVFITGSVEDLDALPADVRERLQKENGLAEADSYELGDSTKTVQPSNVKAGGEVVFTIVAKNTGDADTQAMTVVDTLPSGLTYVSSEVKNLINGLQTAFNENSNGVTWEGFLAVGGSVEIVIVAKVADDAPTGTVYTNKAVITAGDKTAEPSANLSVVDELPGLLLPRIVDDEIPEAPDIPSIVSTRPNSQNQWTVSWAGAGAIAFQLQESLSPGFENAGLMPVGPEAAKSFVHTPTPYNTFYYRVRAVSGGIPGSWSDTIKVIGGFRDDFSDDPSQIPEGDPGRWLIRRTSNLDEVNAWYERTSDYTAYILEVSDRWDLGLSSSLAESPEIPYAIELRVKSVEPGWQKGLGLVFAGDRDTVRCPVDTNSVLGWYAHDDCFNEFYEMMLVEGADKKNLQVQRIHDICFDCSPGGIPVHRKVAKNWYIEKISGVSWDDYNILRVEVYANQIKFYAYKSGESPKLQLTIDESYYQGNHMFGVISTTQEYSNSVGRYTYYEVMPLDG